MAVASEQQTVAPADRRAWIGLGVLAAGLSMIIVDGTIVGVSLPVIIDDLGLDLSDAQWVNSVYSVVFAALLLTAGRLGDRLGRRRMFVVGVLLFMAGSLLAAAAGGAAALIIARAVQGVGGALVLPSTLSSVNARFRGRDRAVAFGVWGAVISGMAAVGPLLGGWLTTSFTWPWIFLVNIPLGIAVIVGAYLAVPETRAHITTPGLDVDGLLLSALGFGAVVFALIEGQSMGWWFPSPVPVIGLVGIALLALFVYWEGHRARVGRSALLDLRLFRLENFSWGNITAMAVAIGEFGLLFVLPLFLVNALGLSTMGAGLVLAAMAAGAFVSGASARHLAARLGAPGVVMLGLGIETVGIAAVALFLTSHVSTWLLAGLLAVYGVGLGLASAQLTGTVLLNVPTEESGQGSATQSTVRQIGAALGSAILGAVLALGLANTLDSSLDKVDGLPPAAAEQLENATRESAGGAITGVREQGETATAEALSEGFGEATRLALFVAAGFVAVGFATSTRLRSETAEEK